MKRLTLQHFFISLFLAIVSIFLTLIFFLNSDISPSTLSVNYDLKNIKQTNSKIFGYFKAEHDYLGIVTVPFNISYKLSGESVFRIKDINSLDWYHVATISADQYYAIPEYTFGLPIIDNSKDRNYYFEVELLEYDNQAPPINLNSQKKYFKSTYAYPSYVLFRDYLKMASFFQKKIFYYLKSDNVLNIFLVYSLPLLIYLLLFVVNLKRFIPKDFKFKVNNLYISLHKPTFILVLLAILFDIFIIRRYSDWTIIFLSLSYSLTQISEKRVIEKTFFITAWFMFFSPFLVWAKMDWIVEKLGIWVYIFLIIGALEGILEFSTYSNNLYRLKIIKILFSFFKSVVVIIDKAIYKAIYNIKKLIYKLIKFVYKKWPKTNTEWILMLIKAIALVFIISIIFLGTIFISIKVYEIYKIEDHKRIRLTLNPKIMTIEPTLVYKSTFIIIYGKNFDWQKDENVYLIVDGKKVNTTLWTASRIVFQIPLDWSMGEHEVWIEKPIVWDGRQDLARSEIFTFKILPITDQVTYNDELYFEQMKSWKPETRKINGYK